MERLRFKLFLEKTMVIIMILIALLIAFFKPAVSIGMVGLLILTLLRFFLFKKNLSYWRIQKGGKILITVYLFFLLWLVLSVFWSADIAEAAKRLQRFSPLLILPIIIGVNSDLIQKNYISILKAAVLSCSAAAVPTFWFFIFPEQIPIGDDYTFIFKELSNARDYCKFGAYSPFLDRLYFGYLTGFCLLGLLYLWIKDAKPGIIHWSFFLLVPLVIILGARGAQLAFLLAFAVGYSYFFLGKSETGKNGQTSAFRSFIFLGIGFSLATLLLILVVRSPRYAQIQWEWSEFKQNPTDWESMSEHTLILRLISWDQNLNLIREKPLKGVGIGNYVNSMEKSYKQAGILLPVHTNQQFLFFGVIGGLPGLLAFSLFFILSGWYAWKRMKSKLGTTAVLAIWIFMLIVMLFDSPLNYHMPSFLFLSVWMVFLFVSD